MKLWPVAPFFHSLLESGNIQNIAACHFLYCCKEMTCCNVLYVPRFQKWVKKRGNRSGFHSERNYYLQNWYFYLQCEKIVHMINKKYFSYFISEFLKLLSSQKQFVQKVKSQSNLSTKILFKLSIWGFLQQSRIHWNNLRTNN